MNVQTPGPAHRPGRSPAPSTRTGIVVWLRKTHGWIGLWGATLGLLFGISGIWLNHRSVLKLEAAQERSNFQVALPDPGPIDAGTLAAWLQLTLSLNQQATSVRVEPAKPVAWLEKPAGGVPHPGRGEGGGRDVGGQGARGGDAERQRGRDREPADTPAAPGAAAQASAPAAVAVAASAASSAPASTPMQPEHWTINFGGPKANVQADYWVGNRSVGIRRTENGFIATLTNLHKGVGMPVAWILLVDTLAGSLILLSISGLALWMLTRRKRAVGIAIFGTALVVTAGLALAHL